MVLARRKWRGYVRSSERWPKRGSGNRGCAKLHYAQIGQCPRSCLEHVGPHGPFFNHWLETSYFALLSLSSSTFSHTHKTFRQLSWLWLQQFLPQISSWRTLKTLPRYWVLARLPLLQGFKSRSANKIISRFTDTSRILKYHIVVWSSLVCLSQDDSGWKSSILLRHRQLCKHTCLADSRNRKFID